MLEINSELYSNAITSVLKDSMVLIVYETE